MSERATFVITKDAMAFVRDIQAGNFDAAGIFADWLEEQHDSEARYRGKLLRRRWKVYQREREAEIAAAKQKEKEIVTPFLNAMESLRSAGFEVTVGVAKAVVEPAKLAQLRFWRYVQKHFPLPEFKHLEARP
jgi:hypothetical protein